MQQTQAIETGTVTVGIVCKEGVVLGAERRVTTEHFVYSDKERKILNITPEIAVTTSGAVSDIQLLVRIIRAEIKLKEIRLKRKITVKEVATLLSTFVYENLRKISLIPGITFFLMGGLDKTGLYLYSIPPDGTLTHITDFVCSGSGSELAYGVLESKYKKGMPLKEGIELAKDAINAAIKRNTACGGGIDIITITKEGIKQVYAKEIKISFAEKES